MHLGNPHVFWLLSTNLCKYLQNIYIFCVRLVCFAFGFSFAVINDVFHRTESIILDGGNSVAVRNHFADIFTARRVAGGIK